MTHSQSLYAAPVYNLWIDKHYCFPNCESHAPNWDDFKVTPIYSARLRHWRLLGHGYRKPAGILSSPLISDWPYVAWRISSLEPYPAGRGLWVLVGPRADAVILNCSSSSSSSSTSSSPSSATTSSRTSSSRSSSSSSSSL